MLRPRPTGPPQPFPGLSLKIQFPISKRSYGRFQMTKLILIAAMLLAAISAGAQSLGVQQQTVNVVTASLKGISSTATHSRPLQGLMSLEIMGASQAAIVADIGRGASVSSTLQLSVNAISTQIRDVLTAVAGGKTEYASLPIADFLDLQLNLLHLVGIYGRTQIDGAIMRFRSKYSAATIGHTNPRFESFDLNSLTVAQKASVYGAGLALVTGGHIFAVAMDRSGLEAASRFVHIVVTKSGSRPDVESVTRANYEALAAILGNKGRLPAEIADYAKTIVIACEISTQQR